MKTFYNTLSNIIVPKFLRNFDEHLLRNYPFLWWTRAHFVLFYSLFAAIVFFLLGFFTHVDAQKLAVNPTTPINMMRDEMYMIFGLFGIIGILFWAYRQYQLGFPFTRTKDVLLVMASYVLCFYVIFAITIPAYRLGTIYKTAYFWINDTDLATLEQSGVYPYGFAYLPDEVNVYDSLPTNFFAKAEQRYREMYRAKDTLAQHIYNRDTLFWREWYAGHSQYVEGSRQAFNSELIEKRESLEKLFLSSYSVNFWTNANTNFEADVLAIANPYENNQWFHNKLNLDYEAQKVLPNLGILVEKYNLGTLKDPSNSQTESDEGFTLTIPPLSRNSFDAVRSVKHARLYLSEKIYWTHALMVLHLVLSLSILLILVSYFDFKIFLVCISFYSLMAFATITIKTGFILAVPLLCLAWLGLSILLKKSLWGTDMIANGLLVSLFAAFRFTYLLQSDSKSTAFKGDFEIYAVQIIGLLGVLLLTQVKNLPKR